MCAFFASLTWIDILLLSAWLGCKHRSLIKTKPNQTEPNACWHIIFCFLSSMNPYRTQARLWILLSIFIYKYFHPISIICTFALRLLHLHGQFFAIISYTIYVVYTFWRWLIVLYWPNIERVTWKGLFPYNFPFSLTFNPKIIEKRESIPNKNTSLHLEVSSCAISKLETNEMFFLLLRKKI